MRIMGLELDEDAQMQEDAQILAGMNDNAV